MGFGETCINVNRIPSLNALYVPGIDSGMDCKDASKCMESAAQRNLTFKRAVVLTVKARGLFAF
jgi:hypothetical protein